MGVLCQKFHYGYVTEFCFSNTGNTLKFKTKIFCFVTAHIDGYKAHPRRTEVLPTRDGDSRTAINLQRR